MNRHDSVPPRLGLDPAPEVPFLQIHYEILLHISTDSEAGITHHQYHLYYRIFPSAP